MLHTKFSLARAKTHRKVVEHLIDCDQNKIFADLYGAGSEYCFQRGPHFFEDIGALFGQLSQIAFFAVATLFLQRGYFYKLDEDVNRDDVNQADDNFGNGSDNNASMRCPQW
jgi:hypothetical protein